MSKPTTQAGQRIVTEVEAILRDRDATIAALREALADLVDTEHGRLTAAGMPCACVVHDTARRVLADTAAAARNYLDLASPEAERRIAEALALTTRPAIDPTEHAHDDCLFRPEDHERARDILAALREQP